LKNFKNDCMDLSRVAWHDSSQRYHARDDRSGRVNAR
jgi:hypothetical protein